MLERSKTSSYPQKRDLDLAKLPASKPAFLGHEMWCQAETSARGVYRVAVSYAPSRDGYGCTVNLPSVSVMLPAPPKHLMKAVLDAKKDGKKFQILDIFLLIHPDQRVWHCYRLRFDLRPVEDGEWIMYEIVADRVKLLHQAWTALYKLVGMDAAERSWRDVRRKPDDIVVDLLLSEGVKATGKTCTVLEEKVPMRALLKNRVSKKKPACLRVRPTLLRVYYVQDGDKSTVCMRLVSSPVPRP